MTGQRIELDESAKAVLDEKLRLLAEVIEERPEAEITYFLPDKKKAGGEYVTAAGRDKSMADDDGRQAVPLRTVLRTLDRQPISAAMASLDGMQPGRLCQCAHCGKAAQSDCKAGALLSRAVHPGAAAEIEAVGGKPPLRQPLGVVPD